jgi:hypothetical protein
MLRCTVSETSKKGNPVVCYALLRAVPEILLSKYFSVFPVGSLQMVTTAAANRMHPVGEIRVTMV